MPDEKLRQIFAENLNNYLELNGYSQADLARHMHVSTASTAKWCTGQSIPRIDKIQSICNWLGIEKSDLLEDKHGQKPQYYLNPETAKVAQEIYEDDNLHALFDAARGASPEELQRAKNFLQMLKDTNPDG